MIRYINYDVVFNEIPDMISLAINISNCKNNCKGCHSPELRKNIGDELSKDNVDILMEKNSGVNCVVFMGEGNDKESLFNIAKYIKDKYKLKIAIYSGRDEVEDDFYTFWDYVKIGRYDEKFGALNEKTTNQKLFINNNDKIEDITFKFWNKKRL